MKIFFFLGLFFCLLFLSAIMDWFYKKINNYVFNKLIIRTQKKIDDLLECEKTINSYFNFSYNKPEQIAECEIMMKQLNKTMETAQKLMLLYKSMIIK